MNHEDLFKILEHHVNADNEAHRQLAKQLMAFIEGQKAHDFRGLLMLFREHAESSDQAHIRLLAAIQECAHHFDEAEMLKRWIDRC